jgi:hypothetical protein
LFVYAQARLRTWSILEPLPLMPYQNLSGEQPKVGYE